MKDVLYRKMDLNLTAVSIFLLLRIFNVVLSEKAEGSSCKLEDGSEGICLRLSQCEYAAKGIGEMVFPKFCSFNIMKPTVCCLDCSNITITDSQRNRFMANDYGRANMSINQKCIDQMYHKYPCNRNNDLKQLHSSIICYEKMYDISPVIAGGRNAGRHEFQHMALIGYGNDPDNAEWLCGGSVISEYFILTAAHCISSPSVGPVRFAALGVHARSDRPSTWQRYIVVRIIVYPGYHPPSKYHDIALLATGMKIRYNIHVLPACLHRGWDMPRMATATGWGTVGDRKPLADILQVVDLHKFSDADCRKAYPVHRLLKHGYDSSTQVCYGDEEKISDTCQGDSGGPLQVKVRQPNSRCLYIVIGVTSYGKACGYIGSAGMYTKVSYYVPWIESITGMLL